MKMQSYCEKIIIIIVIIFVY